MSTRTKKAKEQQQLEHPATKPQVSGPRATFGDPILELPIEQLQRHPKNRVPKAADVVAIAESLATMGQLEPIVVRLLEADGSVYPQYQIISGETRWLAAQKNKAATIRGRVVECGDAEALRLLARFNADRADLDPIQRAILIEELCRPADEGGSGLTREEAGREVGLKSGSAASNLVRLLELPKVWRDRVAAGELPESFARCLLRVMPIPKALESFERDWKDHVKAEADPKKHGMYNDPFNSRADMEEAIEQEFEQSTCSLSPTDKHHWYGSSQRGIPHQRYGCEIPQETIEARRAELKIITIEGQEYATNTKLFDELNEASVAERYAKRSKGKADSATKKPTKKVDPKQRAQQLERGIREWRQVWLRKAIAAAVVKTKDTDPRTIELLLHFLRNHSSGVDDALEDEKLTAVQGIAAMLTVETHWKDPQPACHVEDEDLVEWFGKYGLDAVGEWRAISGSDFVTEFYSLFRSDELVELGKELGCHITGSEQKKIMIGRLVMSPRPLPKCLKMGEKRKAKR